LKLHILSDLHLEFAKYEPIATDAEVVILAGDIYKGADGIHWAAEQWPNKPVIYVPGNHEFYGAQRLNVLAELRIAARETGVHLLDNDELVIDGEVDSVRFLGTTLWTDFELHGAEVKPYAMNEGQRGLSDFRVIHEGVQGHFSPQRSIELHKESLAWLEKKLAETFVGGKTVVVSHHLPSMQSVAARYKTDLLSACFASNLDHLFDQMDLWVHGHTHDSFDYASNGAGGPVSQGTRVVCNPRGYETYRGIENYVFDPRLVVEV